MLAAFLGILACFQTSTPAAVSASAPTQSPPQPQSLRPIPFWQVKLEDDFWAPRIRTTIEKTIPACFDQCEKTGRIANWDKAAKKEGKFEGYFFNDSDVYKVIEAAAYALKLDPNATYKGRKLDEYVDELIAKIAAMQQPDGYVNSYFVLTGEPKWTDIEHKHELYCAGHLIEAAVAHFQCTGKRNLLDIAIKLADHICNVFGPAEGKNHNPCGHPEIELALVKLAALCNGQVPKEWVSCTSSFGSNTRADQEYSGLRLPKDNTRTANYFRLAQFFLEQHGRRQGREKLWGEYALDDVPLCERREIAGHAVRAMYLLAAAADLSSLDGDRTGDETKGDPRYDGYRPALDSLWRDLTERKMYITGGIGSSASNEGFTAAYDLPNETAYAETCASIGLVFWAHRMNLLHADGRYFDVLERALYNNVLAAISLDGTQFNYVNPLASRGQHRRQPWHACACCPPNLSRLFPTVGGYMYAQSDKAIYVNMYAKSTATFQHGDATVTIKQETKYPWEGPISLIVTTDKPCDLEIWLRIPDWCHRRHKLQVSNLLVGCQEVERGYLSFGTEWRTETVVKLEFPMPVQRTFSHPLVKANRGRIAFQRGPFVYCFEDRDVKFHNLSLEQPLRLAFTPFEEGVTDTIFESKYEASLSGALTIDGLFYFCPNPPNEPRQYWSTNFVRGYASGIPYYAWNNREAGDMLVWIPESPAFLDPQPVAWLKPSASHCWKLDTLAALHDRQEPSNSSDAGIPRFTWWPKKSDEQWVQYDFDKPRTVSAVDIYWFDDSKRGGGCKPPAEWRLQSKVGEEWLNVSRGLAYGVETDRFNRVSFDPVDTTGLRIVAKLADGFSAGILEWKVE